MLGISQEVTEHTLNINPSSRPVKQGMRQFNQEKCQGMGEEVSWILVDGFVKEI
jgi:hypothetical protein